MQNPPSKLELEKIPELQIYNPSVNPGKIPPPENTIIYEHFFVPSGYHWYAAESLSTGLMFGFVILNMSRSHSEWTLFRLSDLEEFKVWGREVERDLDWKPREARLVEDIVKFDGFEKRYWQ